MSLLIGGESVCVYVAICLYFSACISTLQLFTDAFQVLSEMQPVSEYTAIRDSLCAAVTTVMLTIYLPLIKG